MKEGICLSDVSTLDHQILYLIVNYSGDMTLVNEDTLLPMMFLGLRKLGNIFCVPDTKFVSATKVAREGKRGNICVANNVSATMCPRLPGPYKQSN